jgi:hypothetical protein
VQGAPVKLIPPDTPFKYLGIHLTLTLDRKHPYCAMLTAGKCCATSNSGLPAGMLMKVIRTVIKPMITLIFEVAPYTIDAQLASAAKAAYKQRVMSLCQLLLQWKTLAGFWSGTHLPATGPHTHTPASVTG